MLNLKELKVGNAVAYMRWHSMTIIEHGFSTVKKINGHGHITLDNGKQFDKYGRERGKDYAYCTLTEVEVLQSHLTIRDAQRTKKKTVNDIEQIVKASWGYSGVPHFTIETKSQLLALVNSLEVTE